MLAHMPEIRTKQMSVEATTTEKFLIFFFPLSSFLLSDNLILFFNSN